MKLSSPLEDQCAVATADTVRDLRRKAFVVHQEKVNFPDIVDEEFLQAVGEKMPRLIER